MEVWLAQIAFPRGEGAEAKRRRMRVCRRRGNRKSGAFHPDAPSWLLHLRGRSSRQVTVWAVAAATCRHTTPCRGHAVRWAMLCQIIAASHTSYLLLPIFSSRMATDCHRCAPSSVSPQAASHLPPGDCPHQSPSVTASPRGSLFGSRLFPD